MKRHVLILGLVGGILIAVLKWTEYRFLVVENSVEIYASLIAAIFALLGIWLGLKLTSRRPAIDSQQAPPSVPHPSAEPLAPVPEPAAFAVNQTQRDHLGITRRELEILGLVAQGMSNREIASRLFVSENTVKTHCSRAFDKLGAKRRTQAVQLGKELGLLP
jgi:DNA-binding CsgD family transcriptional regulator